MNRETDRRAKAEARRQLRARIETDRRAEAEARRQRRTRICRVMLRLLGLAAVLAFVAAGVLEWQAGRTMGAAFAYGGPLFNWSYPLLALLAALLGQRRNSKDDQRRRAEAYGIAAPAAFIYWNLTAPPDYRNLFADLAFDRFVAYAAIAYGLSAVSLLWWSAVSFTERRAESPPTADQIEELNSIDNRTMRTTLWTVATCVVPGLIGLTLIVTSLGENMGFDEFSRLLSASRSNMLAAAVFRGLWFPLAWAGLGLVVRGRWAYRQKALIWALVLLAASALAWPLGKSVSESRIDVARLASIPIFEPGPSQTTTARGNNDDSPTCLVDYA